MTNKKEPKEVLFQADELRGLVTAWLKDSTSDPETYLTKEGMAYLNGFCQSNNTIGLIKKEKYDKVVKDFEELIENYKKLKLQKIPLYRKILDFFFSF